MKQGELKLGGGVIFWKVGPTDRQAFEAGLRSLGLEKYVPDHRTPKAILQAALGALYAEGPPSLFEREQLAAVMAVLSDDEKAKLTEATADVRRIVRPVAKTAAFNVLLETRAEPRNLYKVMLDAAVTKDGVVTSDPPEYREAIQAAFVRMAGELPASTVTTTLVAVLKDALGGLMLRPTGGVYWLQAEKLDQWSKVAELAEATALTSGDSCVHLMRTAMDEAAMRAVKDAITDEVRGSIERIQREITDGNLGTGALESKVAEAGRLRTRLGDYEELLGSAMADVHAQLETVTTAAAHALVLASAKASA